MISSFPVPLSESKYKEGALSQEKIIETIKLIRNAKTDAKIPSNVKSEVYFGEKHNLGVTAGEIEKLATILLSDTAGEGKIIYTPLGEFILLDEKKDKSEIIKELEAEIAKVQFEVERSEKMLSNSKFVEKAPQSLVESEKSKLSVNQKTLLNLKTKLNSLK